MKNSSLSRWQALLPIKSHEKSAVLFAFFYVFSLFTAYYILRPIRDELGVNAGVRNLAWLFSATLLIMLLINPLFASLVKRLQRQQFIQYIYRFFSLNLLGFALGLYYLNEAQQICLGRSFFIWVSVFNLFAVSIFWSLMVDIFSTEQSKRLFSLLASGATLGGLVGASLTANLVQLIGNIGLLFIAIVLLEIAVQLAKRLSLAPNPSNPNQNNEIIGGSIFAGMKQTFRSPYLLGISAFILLYTITSTLPYFQQADIAERYFSDRNARTAFFANIDL